MAEKLMIGTRVHVGPAYRGNGAYSPDGFEGAWFVVNVRGDDYGLSRHPDDDTETWINASRIVPSPEGTTHCGGRIRREVCDKCHAPLHKASDGTRCPQAFAPFATMRDVVAHLRADRPLYYSAPLSYRPVLLNGRARPFGTERVFILVDSSDGDSFTADAGHLPRFSRPFESNERTAV